MGEHVGQHEIHLSAAGETITLRHTAHSREAFAAGALRAAAWLISRPPGYYTMNDVLG
jgi:4-hydroxy-tetrahydrodipicolinate reductase